MGPGEFFTALLMVLGIPAVTIVTVTRIRASRQQAPSPDVGDRLEAVEQRVESLQRELSEAQERLDFAERLLARAREERRLGS